MSRTKLQRRRSWFQVGFFVVFIMAPPLDIFRLDLTIGHFILFGWDWTLGIDGLIHGSESALAGSLNLILRGLIPLLGGVVLFLWIAWRFGRLYCGWLCPHFSVVEVINRLMWRASGKPSLWDRRPLPQLQADGTIVKPNPLYWIAAIVAILAFSLIWAVVLLTYLLPPGEIYYNLFTAQLTRNQSLFIGVGTILLAIEFTLARHLFCRFACAVGLFQSLAWMSNDRAMVVGFDTSRARECGDCNNACDNVCPMRLKPRTLKRKMFTCTECAECISACRLKKGGDRQVLSWVCGKRALSVVTGRNYPDQPSDESE